jgi:Aerotolerance regulator N-terminal
MIGWQIPGALWAMPVAAIPVVIHLLRRHRAERVPFPTLRFVRASQTAAVRIRLPSDAWLMALRALSLAAAVAALAGPVVVTQARLSEWDSTVARAVVVDVSESMRRASGDGATPKLAAEAADAESGGLAYSDRIETADLRSGIVRAWAWLSALPPSRKEILVISDFQRGAMDERDLADAGVPDTVGLRFVAVGRPPDRDRITGVELLAMPLTAAKIQTIDLTPEATAVTVEARGEGRIEGVRIAGRSWSAEDTTALLRTVAAAGVPAGSRQEPIAIGFGDGGHREQAAAIGPVRSGWMLGTILRMRTDRAMLAAAGPVAAIGSIAAERDIAWSVVARDRDGKPLVVAAAAGEELLIDVAAPSRSLPAAAALRAVLTARRPPSGYDEREIAAIDSSVLARWNRPAAQVRVLDTPAGEFWHSVEHGDARWCWAAVLVLLGIEQWARARDRTRETPNEVDRAAA